MTYYKLTRFSGIAPAVSSRLLGEQFAQTSQNIDFEAGRITPITEETTTATLTAGTRNSIYYYENSGTNQWLQWDNDYIKAVEGPIPGDTLNRLYWSGETYPKMSHRQAITSGSAPFPTTAYRLGIPIPANLSIALSGTADPNATPIDVAYVLTFVSNYGEEGPPSAVTATTSFTPSTQTITVTRGTLPTGNYALSSTQGTFPQVAKWRLYRSAVGSTQAAFQLVHEAPDIANTQYADQLQPAQLQEVIPSTTWIGPPDDDTTLYPDGPMQGLIPVANGVFAGFTGRRLCLSEPFLPHAWPISYRITLEKEIIAIATTGNGIVCLTDGKPYFVTGTDPSAMVAVEIDLAQACVNKQSVVDMGDYVLYAGPDGLCAIAGTDGSVVTKGLISPAQWNADFAPTTYKAFKHEGTYVAFHSTTSGWVYDPRAQEAAISTTTSSAAVRGGFYNPKDGELDLIIASNVRRYRGSTTNQTATWKSKKFVAPNPVSMSWVHIHADSYPASGTKNRIRVWVDGTVIADYNITKTGNVFTQETSTPNGISNVTLQAPTMRLPSAIGTEWEVEVSGAVNINEVCLSQSIAEINAT
tara:strand:- start:332 stop:2083 length:1752 start_codon:yes stop_codon:yes gene_type:complete